MENALSVDYIHSREVTAQSVASTIFMFAQIIQNKNKEKFINRDSEKTNMDRSTKFY